MAAKISNDQRKQQLDNLISCAICLSYFDDPRLLPCSHTYCLQCIHKTASSNCDRFECPMRDGTVIQKDQIDSLPINRAIRDMVEFLPNMIDTTQPICCDCSSAVAELWCSDCKNGFCTKCSTDAHNRRAFEKHQRVPIHEKPAELKRCDKHPDEKLKYWCSCETLICRDCQLSKQHKDHTPVPIVEVVTDITEKLKASFKEVQTNLTQTTAQGPILAIGNEDANIQMITRTFDTLRKAIDTYEETLKNQVRIIEKKNKSLLKKYLTLLNNKQTELSQRNTEFETILTTNDHAQLLEAKTRLTDRLDQLTNELKALEPPIKTEYCVEGVDKLPLSINDVLKVARVGE